MEGRRGLSPAVNLDALIIRIVTVKLQNKAFPFATTHGPLKRRPLQWG
ncbi:hypothetical protein E2C01_055834 [Portunus trituberculatus]|uniref:Uncharacterized protein n=1 Tax=Portunus trituberculatus TaxID=210409 RepID=A0A5B7GY09_PORTR|nr:hypothetical protein [Portunus trituberculatus]